jgi:hypothetical protein
MIPEALPRAKADILYNPAYDNGHPPKTIQLNGHYYLVHETSNLPDLIDAYFHEQWGFGRVGYQARAAHTKLRNPIIAEAFQTILSANPEYAKTLEALTEERDEEYSNRIAARNGQRVPRRLLNPSEEEQCRRDFIYSSFLDHIGDVQPDNNLLTEICA